MDGGPSKVNPPNSHPSNPIHKAVMAAQDPKPAKKTPKQVRFKLPKQRKTRQSRNQQNSGDRWRGSSRRFTIR